MHLLCTHHALAMHLYLDLPLPPPLQASPATEDKHEQRQTENGTHKADHDLRPDGLDQLAADGDADQGGQRGNEVQGAVVAAKRLGLAQLADASGGQGHPGTGAKAKQGGEGVEGGEAGVAKGQPEGEHEDEGADDHDEERVEAADEVGQVARDDAAQAGDAVHDGDDIEARVGRELATVAHVRGQDAQGAEEHNLEPKDADSQERELEVAEEAQRDDAPRLGLGRRGQSGLHQDVGDGQAGHEDEAQDADRPGVAILGERGPQDQRDCDAAETRSHHGDAVREPAASLEPVADHRHARRGQRRAGRAAQEAHAEQELPVVPTLGQQEDHDHVADAAHQRDPSRPVPVEQWAHPDPQGQREIDEDGRNPPDVA